MHFYQTFLKEKDNLKNHENHKLMIALLFQLEEKTGQKSYEEKRMEKLLRKTAKEIYKLRKTKSIKGQLDVQSFKYVVKKLL